MEDTYMNFKRLYKERIKNTPTMEDLPAIVGTLQQPSPKGYGLTDRINDVLHKRGIGAGSEHTQILNNKAEARAKLMRFIRKPENITAFQRLPDSQKKGIISMIKGGD